MTGPGALYRSVAWETLAALLASAAQAQMNLDCRIRRNSAERLEYVRSMSAIRC
jgi:hypothetical protein